MYPHEKVCVRVIELRPERFSRFLKTEWGCLARDPCYGFGVSLVSVVVRRDDFVLRASAVGTRRGPAAAYVNVAGVRKAEKLDRMFRCGGLLGHFDLRGVARNGQYPYMDFVVNP